MCFIPPNPRRQVFTRSIDSALIRRTRTVVPSSGLTLLLEFTSNFNQTCDACRTSHGFAEPLALASHTLQVTQHASSRPAGSRARNPGRPSRCSDMAVIWLQARPRKRLVISSAEIVSPSSFRSSSDKHIGGNPPETHQAQAGVGDARRASQRPWPWPWLPLPAVPPPLQPAASRTLPCCRWR